MTHDELASNLARSLMLSNRIVFTGVGLGASWTMSARTRGIVDVISISPHYRNPDITIYEIKVGRGDLLCDLRKEKYKKYSPFCNRLVFAYPKGLATEKDIPLDCGIATYNPDKKSWAFRRRGKENREYQFDYEMFLSILISAHYRERNRYDKQYFIERFLLNGSKQDSMKFGKKVSNALWEIDKLRDENKYMEYRIGKDKTSIKEYKKNVPVNLCAYFDEGHCDYGVRSICHYPPSSTMADCWKSEITKTKGGE